MPEISQQPTSYTLYPRHAFSIGALLGGPLFAIYALYYNFKHIERRTAAKFTIGLGAAWIALLSFLILVTLFNERPVGILGFLVFNAIVSAAVYYFCMHKTITQLPQSAIVYKSYIIKSIWLGFVLSVAYVSVLTLLYVCLLIAFTLVLAVFQ